MIAKTLAKIRHARRAATPAEIERFVWAAKNAGVVCGQLYRFLQAGIILQPQQWKASVAARQADLDGGPDVIGYGGARGGGKSHWGLAQLVVDDCQRFPGLKFLLLRKVGVSNKEAFQDLRRSVLARVPHEYNAQGWLKLPNGSRGVLGHFKDEKDVDKYLGLEYDVILVEEATTLTRSKVKMIRTCLRTSKPGWRPRMYLTTNPGNLGHAWFKEMIVDPHRKDEETNTRFIPATVYDNAFVNKEYRSTLEDMSGWQRRAWLEGDWDIAAGQYFTNWRHDTHVIKPFAIPGHWRVWGSMDVGFAHWNMMYVFAQDDENQVYIIGEYAAQRTLVPRLAEGYAGLLERLSIKKERLEVLVAGGDAFNTESDGEAVVDKWKQEGFTFKRANLSREERGAEMLSRLGDVDAVDPVTGKPKPILPTLHVFDTCPMLIETIPTLQHDPHYPEKVLKMDIDADGKNGDDAYDAAGFGLLVAKRRRGGARSMEANDFS